MTPPKIALKQRQGFLERAAAAGFVLGLLVGGAVAAVLFAIISAHSQQNAGDPHVRVLRLAHALDPAHPVHLGMERFGEEVNRLSGGRIRVDIFPSGQLGSETESTEQLQQGVLAMVKSSTASMENFVPEMAVFGLPFLFRDHDHFWDVLNSEIGQEFLESGVRLGLRGICYYDAGSRSFYTTNRPILSPDDLRGMKIRVLQSRMAMDMISQMGGSPTPISWGELYTALQQGMVDGAENNPPSFYSSRHFEVARHFSINEHTKVPDILLFSERIWQTLSPQEQAWIMEAAELSVVYQRQVWDEYSENAMQSLRRHGVQVYYPEIEPFRQRVAPLYERFEGTRIGEYVERIRAH